MSLQFSLPGTIVETVEQELNVLTAAGLGLNG